MARIGEAEMLKIREFVRDRDEQTWVSVLNAAYGKFRDWRTITVEEHFKEGSGSDLAFEGRWMAELNGLPAGTIRAFIQAGQSKRKGQIEDLGVAPEFVGLGVEEKLAELATDQLRQQDVETILVPRLRWPDPGGDGVEFLEKLGFSLIRQISLMEMDLAKTPTGVASNREVAIRPLRENAEEDVQKLNWLRNQCSKGYFNYRPSTIEETRYFLQNNPYSWLGAFFATLNDDSVGFSVLAIDEKYNTERNVKAGIILAIGVLENHRKAGIGTKLVLHGLKVLRDQKMIRAVLDVDDLNQTGAMRLYEKIGFEVVEKYSTYEKSYS
ncbi:MAG: GNAT family N-acetyltransferase [Nitrososphaeria archaeon]